MKKNIVIAVLAVLLVLSLSVTIFLGIKKVKKSYVEMDVLPAPKNYVVPETESINKINAPVPKPVAKPKSVKLDTFEYFFYYGGRNHAHSYKKFRRSVSFSDFMRQMNLPLVVTENKRDIQNMAMQWEMDTQSRPGIHNHDGHIPGAGWVFVFDGKAYMSKERFNYFQNQFRTVQDEHIAKDRKERQRQKPK